MGDELIRLAADELRKDSRPYFCLECGRPRTRNYCPWNAKHPEAPEHKVYARNRISTDSQLHYFIKNKEDRRTRHVFKK